MQTLSNLVIIGLVGLTLTACSDGSSSKKAAPDLFPEVRGESIETYRETENCEESVDWEFRAEDGNVYSGRTSTTSRTDRNVEKFVNNVERHRVQSTSFLRRCFPSTGPCYNSEYRETGTDLQRTTSMGQNLYSADSEENLVSTLVRTDDPEEEKFLNKAESSKTTGSILYRLEGDTKHLLEATFDGIRTRVDGALIETRSSGSRSDSYRKTVRLLRPIQASDGARMLRWDSTCEVQKL